MSGIFPDGPGGAPGNPNYQVPPTPRPTDPRMAFPGGAINQTSLYQNPLAQQAYLARQFGINPGERSLVGDTILGDLGGMLRDYITYAGADAGGRPMGNASALLDEFANRMRGNDFYEWIAGQATGLLGNPTVQANLASQPLAVQQRAIQNLTGMQTAGMNPMVSEARGQQVQGGLGNIMLAQAEQGRHSPLLRYIAETPEYQWLLTGR